MFLPSRARSGSSQACQVAGTHVPAAGPWSRDEQPLRALPGPHPECGADRTRPRTGLCGGAPGGGGCRPRGGTSGKGALSRAKLDPTLQNDGSSPLSCF